MSSGTVTGDLAASPDLLAVTRVLLSGLFVLMVPLLLIGTDLRWLVTDRQLMLDGFRANNVAQTTHLDEPQLARIADALATYFQAPRGPLNLPVVVDGQPRPLFNDREVTHMEDVQALVQFFFGLQVAAAIVVGARLIFAVAVERTPLSLGRDLLLSSLLIVLLVGLVGVLSLVSFDDLWTRFHQLAFRNDFWQLDPRSDYLIMLFPEPFWLTATTRMAVALSLETLVLAVAGFLGWRWAR